MPSFFSSSKTNTWIVAIFVDGQKRRSKKKPSETETWCVLFETASATFFKNNTGEL